MRAVLYILLLVAALAGSQLGLGIFVRFLREVGLRRANYAGQEIPLGAGLYLVLFLPLLLVLAILAGLPAFPPRLCLAFAFGVAGLGLAGLIDDALGTAGDKGFRGHFRALLREGRLTSGTVKALFGGLVALFASLVLASFYPLSFGAWYEVVINTLLLASAANLVNLFDLRPGRAGKIFLLGLVFAAALGSLRRIDLLGGPVLLALIVFLPIFRRDLRAELMLGDSGANALGAIMGMAMVFWLTWYVKLIALVFGLCLQIVSERVSFSAAIERHHVLRVMDAWGRKKNT